MTLKLIAPVALLFTVGTLTPVYPDERGGRRLPTAIGDIAFEIVGQFVNPAPNISEQYGYLTFINGLSADQIFETAEPTVQNETTALFTFFTDAITERVIANGRLRIINRRGTTTIYFDEVPDGTFAFRDSFRDGIPVLTLNYRRQVIHDTGTGTFTVVDLLRVVSAESFEMGGTRLRLGEPRDQFRQFFSGVPPSGTLPAVFTGYAVAIGRAERELE